MAQSIGRNLALVIAVGGALLALLVLLGGGALWLVHLHRVACHVRTYDRTAASHMARTYPRPPDPPGWALEPGVAKRDEQRAWELADEMDLRGPIVDDITAARMALQPETCPVPDPVQLAEPGSRTVPEPCLAMGFPDEPGDRMLAQLNRDLCVALSEARPALEALRAGSRRSDALGPMDIWDAWTAPSPGVGRDMRPLLTLSQLAVIHAALQRYRGDDALAARDLACLLRAGQDLGRGGDALAWGMGTVMQQHALDAIHVMLIDPALDEDVAAILLGELVYADRLEPDLAALAEVDYLCVAGLYLGSDRVAVPPGTAWPNPSGMGTVERLTGMGLLGDFEAHDERIAAAAELPFPERVEAYARAEAALADAHRLAQATASTPQRFDARQALARSHLRVLALAAADLEFQRATGRAPSSLEELAARTPGLSLTDPLTDRPFVLEVDGGRRAVSSPVLSGDWIARLDLEAHERNNPLANRLRVPLRDVTPSSDAPQQQP